jgi:hypothetical protein
MSEPTLEWIKQLGTSGGDVARGVAVDSNNNVYITGYTEGELDGINAGGYDAFLAKYDSAGTIVWTTQLGTTMADVAYGVAVDSNNNVYITGYTRDDLDGSGNAGGNDAFLAKYDSAGTIVWTKQLGTSGSDIASGVAIDSSNNVYITGNTLGDLGGSGNAGGADAFLAKYDSAGNIVWTKQLRTIGNDKAQGVAVDSNNNVYITGYTSGDLGGSGNAGVFDAFLAKYDSAGTIVWTKQLGSTKSEIAYMVAIDSNNNVYITGYTSGDLGGSGNAGFHDAFLVKYDSAGTIVWTKQLGITTYDATNSVAVDSNNNVYITGYTQGDLGGSGNAGGADAFLAKYDSAGTIVWTKQLGTTTSDAARGVAIDSNNNVYITGSTSGDLGGINAGGNDVFLAKYSIPLSPEPEPEPTIQGIAPKLVGGGANSNSGSGMEGGSARETMRFTLRQAWNGKAASGTVNGIKVAATPFRAVNNAGDLLNRVDYTSGGSNQVNTGIIKLAANGSARFLGGSIFAKLDGTGVPSANTNVKWVYDGSDYTKFKKQQTANKNYNDSSYGGSNNGSFVPLMRVRH